MHRSMSSVSRSFSYRILSTFKVCSYFRRAIENSATLRYIIKLDMFGYIDGPGRADAARLSQLERHINAWNKLDWVESHIDAPNWRYVLREGIYVSANTTKVVCIQLPYLNRGVLLRTWTLGFEFPVPEIEIDPSNNLLVVVSRRVSYVHMESVFCYKVSRIYRDLADLHLIALHLRTLSDNTPHPSTISPILFPTFPIIAVMYDSDYKVRVMGPLLGVLSFGWEEALEIWNWTTCQKIRC
jgi:hypothetical protein